MRSNDIESFETVCNLSSLSYELREKSLHTVDI
jgi:hypothetical protein